MINAVVVRLFDQATKKAAEIDREVEEMDDERLEEVDQNPSYHLNEINWNHSYHPYEIILRALLYLKKKELFIFLGPFSY